MHKYLSKSSFSRQYLFRTYCSFENQLRKGNLLNPTFNPTDYDLPSEICAMVNVVLGMCLFVAYTYSKF